jgi:hypothetical protein
MFKIHEYDVAILVEMTQLIFCVWNKTKVDYFIAHGILLFMSSNSILDTNKITWERQRFRLSRLYDYFHRKLMKNWTSIYNTKCEWQRGNFYPGKKFIVFPLQCSS